MIYQKLKSVLLTCVIFACFLPVSSALGQGNTTILLESTGDSTLHTAAEENASAVINELYPAMVLQRSLDFSGVAITEKGEEAIVSRWKGSQFYCEEDTLSRSLIEQTNDVYEIREIPLTVENDENRLGVLVLNSEGQIWGFRFADERPVGSISVFSEPSGAVVESSNENLATQTTPIHLKSLPEGTYHFEIRKESYETVDTTFHVEAYKSVQDTVQLTPAYGYLRLDSDPKASQIQVRVDGTTHSTSEEGLVRIDTGEHFVELSKENYQSYDTTLTVSPGQTHAISAELQRKRTSIRVFSEPTNATVILDGDSLGTTPFHTTRETGRAYTLRLDAPGHVPSKQMFITTEPGSPTERDVSLNPIDIQVQDEGVRIENMRAERTDGLVKITYDLRGDSDETYEVEFSITGQDGRQIETSSDAVRGAIGEGIAPGEDKEVYWREELPEGASLRLAQGNPSVATSLTVGHLDSNFQIPGEGADSSFSFKRPLKGVMISGRTSSFSVGFDNFSSTQGSQWAVNLSSKLGGNAHVFKTEDKFPTLFYIPISVRANYLYSVISNDKNGSSSYQNIVSLGLGAGAGYRIQLGRFKRIRRYPVLRSVVLEGVIQFTPSAYTEINLDDPIKPKVSRVRDINIEMRLVDLIDTGVGRKIGVTLGYTHRILRRAPEQPANFGEVVDSAFLSNSLERIATQHLLHVGINWR